MLTTAPHLYVRRPSPTTAEFTVTTRPPMTLPLRLALLGMLLGRSLVVTAALLLLYARWAAQIQRQIPPSFAPAAALLHRLVCPPSVVVQAAAHKTPAWLLLPLCTVAILGAVTARVHTTERLLVLRGLGIQTMSQGGGGGFLNTGGVTRFIATDKVRDVLINEAFRGFEVRYYLVVVVEGEDDMVVVFPRLLPPRLVVEAVWRGVRECLYEPDGVRRVGEEGKGL